MRPRRRSRRVEAGRTASAGRSASWHSVPAPIPAPRAGEPASCRAGCTVSRGTALRRARRRTAGDIRSDRSGGRAVKTYSGGMQRRLDVALGLVHRPRGAVPRRADHRPRPRGTRRDLVGDRPARRRGVARDPADDALPRRGRPSRRAGRHSSIGAGSSPRARPDVLKGELRGDAVHLEMARSAR